MHPERLDRFEAGGSGQYNPKAKPISDIQAITDLEQLTNDRAEFRNWTDSLVNALVQGDLRFRLFMDNLEEAMDQKPTILSDVSEPDEVGQMIAKSGLARTNIEEDLYYIMVEKTKRGSETARRVATAKPGQGIQAWMKVYH